MRSIEFFAGLIGGSFGFISSLFMVLFEFENASDVPWTVWLGFIFSILAITGAIVLRSKGAIGGMMLIIASIGVFFTVAFFHMVSSILIMIAGVMGFTKVDPEKES